MSEFLHNYLMVALVGGLGVVLAGAGLTVNRVLRPDNPSDDKASTYESGADPVGDGWSQTHVRYYLYALLFVVFDVEIAFIIPWAIQVEEFSFFGLVEMAIFVAVLFLGLVYAWRKNVFRWDA